MSRRRESCFPVPGQSHIHSLSRKMCRFSRRRGKLCPGAGKFWSECRFSGKLCPGAEKAASRRQEKVTFTHYRRNISKFFRRWGKLCPGAGKAVSRRPGKVTFVQRRRKKCRFSRRRGKLCPDAGKTVSSAGESCVPAPGKLFPGVGERLAGRRLV